MGKGRCSAWSHRDSGRRRWKLSCALPSHRAEEPTALFLTPGLEGHTGAAPRRGGAPGSRRTPTPSLTLLGGDAGVPLALRPPVGHGLEAAGAYGVASLQGAHVVLGCGTDRTLRLLPPAHGQQERLRPHLEGQLQGMHEDTDLQENPDRTRAYFPTAK